MSAIAGMAALALAAPGCTIARYYSGVPLRADAAILVEGESSKSDVLRIFGPPTQITHQTDGDAFVYAYDRVNFSSITLQEPITGQRVFTYRREFSNRDRLIVLFDFTGIVRGVAVDRHTQDMPAL
ncbi:MAG: hypothetical protein ACHQ9S_21765 [Candidatus Binatia bacterium]